MFTEVISKINKAERIAIFNHINPDGDAFGSAFGLKLALAAMGKQTKVFLREGDVDCKEYKLLKGPEETALKIEDCELKIAVECADLQICKTGENWKVGHAGVQKRWSTFQLLH